jgi:hypothetical protein
LALQNLILVHPDVGLLAVYVAVAVPWTFAQKSLPLQVFFVVGQASSIELAGTEFSVGLCGKPRV